MAVGTVYAAVSFWKTPLVEISAKAGAIEALGWREYQRGDPWTLMYGKDFDEDELDDAEAELRDVMGDLWLSSDEIRAMRGD